VFVKGWVITFVVVGPCSVHRLIYQAAKAVTGAVLPCATQFKLRLSTRSESICKQHGLPHSLTSHTCLRGLLPLVSLLLLLHLLPLLWFKWTLTVIAVNPGLPFLSLLSRLRLRSKGLQTRAIRMYGACQIMTLLVSGCFPWKNRADSCIFTGFKSYLVLICL
jgi:hypothetical protein